MLAQRRGHTGLLKLDPAATVHVPRSHDHRNATEVDRCDVAASSGKICGRNIKRKSLDPKILSVFGEYVRSFSAKINNVPQ